MAKQRLTGRKNLGISVNWQESYAGLVLGAIIVIVLGLLVANFFVRKNQQQIGTGEQTQIEEKENPKFEREYKVAKGDSLSAISQKYFGKSDFFLVLVAANNISNPNLIYPEQIIKIPSTGESDAIWAQLTTTSYQVQEGDTLFTISQKVYGDGFKWPLLHRANGLQRLPNGNPLVFTGSTIVVPR